MADDSTPPADQPDAPDQTGAAGPTGQPDDEFWGPTRFQIGEPWPWEPIWVAERGFKWLPDTGILLMVEDNVTDQMCADMSGPVDLALLSIGPLVGILARFGDNWGWAETMAWRRPGQGIPDNLRPDGSATPHALFYPVLVDAKTKIVRHMRAFTASPHFTRALYREVADRWAEGTTPEGANAAFAEWERKYPSINAALKGSMARCHGGD